MQVGTTAAALTTTAPKKPMSLWWPMSFLIAWVFFSALGGGLFAGGIAQDVTSYDAYGNSYVSNSGSGMAIGGIACLALSGVLGLLFWIVFIVWLVKRSHYRSYNPSTVVYVNHPTAPTNAAAPYHVEPLGGIYAEEAQSGYNNLASTNPGPNSAPAYHQQNMYHSDKPAMRHCGQCGAVATNSPFCAQCGARV